LPKRGEVVRHVVPPVPAVAVHPLESYITACSYLNEHALYALHHIDVGLEAPLGLYYGGGVLRVDEDQGVVVGVVVVS
jgi:hypothetical protein